MIIASMPSNKAGVKGGIILLALNSKEYEDLNGANSFTANMRAFGEAGKIINHHGGDVSDWNIVIVKADTQAQCSQIVRNSLAKAGMDPEKVEEVTPDKAGDYPKEYNKYFE